MWPFTSTRKPRHGEPNRREFRPTGDRLEAREVPATFSVLSHSPQVLTNFAGQSSVTPSFTPASSVITRTMSAVPTAVTNAGLVTVAPGSGAVRVSTPFLIRTPFRTFTTNLNPNLFRAVNAVTVPSLNGNVTVPATSSLLNPFAQIGIVSNLTPASGNTFNTLSGLGLSNLMTPSSLLSLGLTPFSSTLNTGVGTSLNLGTATTAVSPLASLLGTLGMNNTFGSPLSAINSGLTTSTLNGTTFNSGATSFSGIGTSAGTTLNSTIGVTNGLAFNNGLGTGSFGTLSGFGAQSGLAFNNGLGGSFTTAGLGLTF